MTPIEPKQTGQGGLAHDTSLTAHCNQVANLREYTVDFYDRATNMDIEPLTRPQVCIEPIARLTYTEGGKKYAALVNLEVDEVELPLKRTLKQRLLLRKPNTILRRQFDFEGAVAKLHAATISEGKIEVTA